ncbi:MAG: hypothetical protein AAGI71_16360 [Bacteroidota bacterium]
MTVPLSALLFAQTVNSAPTGLEWMLIASFVLPVVILIAILYAGRKSR